MVSHAALIPRKKKGKKQAKNLKGEKDAAVSTRDELNYCIDILNLGKN